MHNKTPIINDSYINAFPRIGVLLMSVRLTIRLSPHMKFYYL